MSQIDRVADGRPDGVVARQTGYRELVLPGSPPSEVVIDACIPTRQTDGVACHARRIRARRIHAWPAEIAPGLQTAAKTLGLVTDAIAGSERRPHDTQPMRDHAAMVPQ